MQSTSDTSGFLPAEAILEVIEHEKDVAQEAFGRHFSAGLVSGLAGKFLEYPFDTVKVRLQTHTSLAASTCGTSPRIVSPGIIKVTKEIYRTQGVRGFYEGIPAPLVGAALEVAVLFSSFVYARDLLYAMRTTKNASVESSSDRNSHSVFKQYGLGTIALAGVFGGVCNSQFLTPIELIKCRMQVNTQSGAPAYTSSFDCLRKTLFQKEVRANLPKPTAYPQLQNLFRGHTSTLLRECPGNAAWFSIYYMAIDFLQTQLEPRLYHVEASRDLKSPSPWIVVLSGSLAGIGYWSAFYPADVVKSCIQTQPSATNSSSISPPKFLPTLRHIYKTEGLGALYKGYLLTITRAAPSNAAVFLAYEATLGLFP